MVTAYSRCCFYTIIWWNVHLYLYEYANVFRLYFIPILKWNKKLYLVCSKCDAAWELNGEIKDELIEESLTSLPMETTTLLWNKVGKVIDEKYCKYKKNVFKVFRNDI